MSRRAMVTGLVAAFSLLFVFSSSQAGDHDWGEISEAEWNQQPPEALPHAGAVILFDIGETEVSISKITLRRHVRMKVFDKKNAEDVTSIEIPYYDGDVVQDFHAQTITPDGKKYKVKDKFKKKSGSKEVIAFTFPTVTDGCILEYRYKHMHGRYSFLDPWIFQGPAYTLDSKFTIVLDDGFSYNVALRNLTEEEQQPERQQLHISDRQAVSFTWEAHDLMPSSPEPLSGALFNYLASVTCQLISYKTSYLNYTFVEDWSDIGEELEDELKDFGGDHDKLEETAERICVNARSVPDAAQALYTFVRDSIQTRSDDGLKYYENKGAVKVLEQGYGDSEHKNMLLVDLLRARGLLAYPLFIGTRGFSTFEPTLHQLSQFNYTVCYWEGIDENLALDASEPGVPFGYLPPDDLVKGGLLLDGEDSEPIELKHRPRRSGVHIYSTLDLDESGDATCSTYVQVCGYELSKYRDYLADPASHLKIVEDMFENSEPQLNIDSVESLFLPDEDSIVIKFAVELPGFAELVDDKLLFAPIALPRFESPFKKDYRIFPVDFMYAFLQRQYTEVHLPPGWKVADLPADEERQLDGARASRTMYSDTNSVNARLYLEIGRVAFQPSEYRDLKDVFDLLVLTSGDQVMLVKDKEGEI